MLKINEKKVDGCAVVDNTCISSTALCTRVLPRFLKRATQPCHGVHGFLRAVDGHQCTVEHDFWFCSKTDQFHKVEIV